MAVTRISGPSLRIGVIADDLTGTFDTGVQFRSWGMSVEVMIGTDSGKMGEAEVLVVDTESRYDSRDVAYRKVSRVAEAMTSSGVDIIYKKVDSTLRGNVGAELDAVMDATGSRMAFIAPAYPAHGRTTRNGRQLIEGRPIDATEYSGELGIGEAHVPSILGDQSRLKIGAIHLKTVRGGPDAIKERVGVLRGDGADAIVFDAESESDLLNVLRCGGGVEVFVGSAGLASEFPHGLGIRSVKPVLAIVGSTRALTRVQAGILRDRIGCAEIRIQLEPLINGAERRREETRRCAEAAIGALANGSDVIVGSALEEGAPSRAISYGRGRGVDEAEVRSCIEDSLGEIAATVLTRASISGLILTGGATALKVINGLGSGSATIIEEVQPGIPLLELAGGLKAVTKAGGFGTEDALVEAVKKLRRAPWS